MLHDLNLEIAPGETLAVVGATGSGKTAFTALVPRLQDVTGGAIRIDGYDIRDLRLPDLRRIVATAFEDPTLFSMSVRENLTLGAPDAGDDEVADAIAVAQAQFVYELPWGLDTRIGEQGLSLSGGQRQRLALARAVLAKPTVLVLDDTLSALDIHTEALVEDALRRVLQGVTGIVVAHRASTVLLADRVAVLSGGTITHVGTHTRAAGRGARVPQSAVRQPGRARRRGDPMSRRAPACRRLNRAASTTRPSRGAGWPPNTSTTSASAATPSCAAAVGPCWPTCSDRTRASSLLLIAVVVLENAAMLSIPWLVQRGIDLGVPPLVAGQGGEVIYQTVGLMVAAVVVQALCRMFFLRQSGRVGQEVLLELRRRLFSHFQRLDIRFHDRYTTGRVVSRLTSDVDAIMELLVGGFDGLVSAALTMVGVAVSAADPGSPAGRGLPGRASRWCWPWCGGSRRPRRGRTGGCGRPRP